jgi:hypothetical protein
MGFPVNAGGYGGKGIVMKEIPILYSTPMAQAKRARIKTQTRRIMNIQPIDCSESHKSTNLECSWHNEPMKLIPDSMGTNEWYCEYCGNGVMIDGHSIYKCAFGRVGDILWGRETFVKESIDGNNWHPVFKADCPNYPLGSSHWKPSIFMPKNIAQLWDRITEIRVERLQDISEEDAIAEGLIKFPYKADFAYTWKHGDNHGYGTAVGAYRSLWESINGPGSWELNPWVWVIKTEILSTTGRPENL